MGRAKTRVTTQFAQSSCASRQGSNKPLALTQPYESHLLANIAFVPWLGRDSPALSLLSCSNRQLSEKDDKTGTSPSLPFW